MRVDTTLLPDLSEVPFATIEDRYLKSGRLRLRKVTAATGTVTYKLGKKYGRIGVFTEPITNLYLTETEYTLFLMIPGDDLRKQRYRFPFQGRTFSLDAHSGELQGLFLCEWEAASESELLAVLPPPFCSADVTQDERYSGAYLARTKRIPGIT